MSLVAILQSSYNGSPFLKDQLRSFEDQSQHDWILINADDGSTDNTRAIFNDFQEKIGHNRVILRVGQRKGFSANFLSLLADQNIKAEYYAFSDQDDIWEPNKLDRALGWLARIPPDVPGLYCTRTRLIDEQGRSIGYSPLFRKPPSFANALVQNIAGGNTMVFNEAARRLVAAGGIVDVPFHDWWLYILVSGVEGALFYDPYCSVRYRCHENNFVGSNLGILPRILRAKMLLQGRFRRWTDLFMAALETCDPPLTSRSRAVLDAFRQARREALMARVGGIRSSGVYRQTRLGTIGLYVGAVLDKI
jgi:glycosyltransferase involved in cell wall biosynthesis